ncbi:MAG: hypothetical protein ACOZF2_02320 [Thermodesulfobacteriota bacterium]
MDVKEAVEIAKHYITDLFRDEEISNLGLEEVDFDEKSSTWSVTIGFSRPWDTRTGINEFAAFMQQTGILQRSYKIVSIDDATKKVRSVKNRETKS